MKGNYKPFTEEQEAKIKKEYLSKPIIKLAKEIGCSDGKISRFLKIKNLEIPQEIRDQRKRLSYFKKGTIPHNKGKKHSEYMSREGIKKCEQVWFKKGHKPHSTKYDGCIRVSKGSDGRNYKYIRLKESVWELLHRVVWEKENGKIPDHHFIIFKDGNTDNITIENLECISKAENVIRNSVHKYPKEIIPSIVLLSKLKSKIKERCKTN